MSSLKAMLMLTKVDMNSSEEEEPVERAKFITFLDACVSLELAKLET